MGSTRTGIGLKASIVILAIFALAHVPSVILENSIESDGNTGLPPKPGVLDDAAAAEEVEDAGECASKPNYIYPNPKNCSTFFKCWKGKLYPIPCPEPLVFNTELLVCDWKWNVTTCDKDPIAGNPKFSYTAILLTGLCVFLVILLNIFLSIKWYLRWREKHRLTAKEMENFFEGEVPNPNNTSINWFVQGLPFDKQYQLTRNHIYIDHNHIKNFSSGEFGYDSVCLGYIKDIGESMVSATIKTAKRDIQATSFKSLLSHLKLMAYVGTHDNIVSLLGAYTSNIKKCELLVAVEYCGKGDLLEYLRANRRKYQQMFSINSGSLSSGSVDSAARKLGKVVSFDSDSSLIQANRSITTLQLVEWTSQIASGMAYLGSKNVCIITKGTNRVIHGDLTLRNVLLTADDVAKIANIGLHFIKGAKVPSHSQIQIRAPLPPKKKKSRRKTSVEVYNLYLRKTLLKRNKSKRGKINPVIVEPPHFSWRWMPIEVLRGNRFTTSSDVWSFGVTMWEIFTLGRVPYYTLHNDDDSEPDSSFELGSTSSSSDDSMFLTKNDYTEFTKRLYLGFRLKSPACANLDIYNIMLSCWKLQPAERATFDSIIHEIQNISTQLQDLQEKKQ